MYYKKKRFKRFGQRSRGALKSAYWRGVRAGKRMAFRRRRRY